mmetsp:Transcript_14542/g.34468  ORF Transcript_14542/g.34468 Transcript_14542/m.34468 type:complete len:193 (-) Transcript_14542:33-611(-)
MLCDTAVELVRELQRDSWLPPYNSGSVNQVVKETLEVYQSAAETMRDKPNEEDRTHWDILQMTTQMACLERNKRCVMAYHKHRAEEIMRVRWECGTSVMQQELQERLSAQELQLSNDYDRLLSNYMINIGEDISMDMEPPRSTKITVRVLKDYGEIATMEGSINLVRNSEHYVRRIDVQHLIRQGYLEHVSS